MGAMSPVHWLIVIGVLLLLFGAKKLPDMARSIGQSARVFKGEIKALDGDENTSAPAGAGTADEAARTRPVEAPPRPTGPGQP